MNLHSRRRSIKAPAFLAAFEGVMFVWAAISGSFFWSVVWAALLLWSAYQIAQASA